MGQQSGTGGAGAGHPAARAGRAVSAARPRQDGGQGDHRRPLGRPSQVGAQGASSRCRWRTSTGPARSSTTSTGASAPTPPASTPTPPTACSAQFAQRYGVQEGRAARMWQPLDSEKSLADYRPPAEVPDAEAVRAALTRARGAGGRAGRDPLCSNVSYSNPWTPGPLNYLRTDRRALRR